MVAQYCGTALFLHQLLEGNTVSLGHNVYRRVVIKGNCKICQIQAVFEARTYMYIVSHFTEPTRLVWTINGPEMR